LHTNSLTVRYLSEDSSEVLATYKLSELSAFVESLQTADQVTVEATGNTRYRDQEKELPPEVRPCPLFILH
jgi:hypothetical protein